MTKEKELYDKYQTTQLKLKELAIMSEKLDRDYQSFLGSLEVTPAQLHEYMENPENFAPGVWDELQKEKEKMDELLKLQMSVLRDPKKIKKKYSERGRVKQNWIFVR